MVFLPGVSPNGRTSPDGTNSEVALQALRGDIAAFATGRPLAAAEGGVINQCRASALGRQLC